MLFSNIQLLIFRVTGKTDDFHTIEQRCRNVHGVRRRDKHDIAEIVIHFQIVVAKCNVLFRIKHFQQSRCWIATHVRRHFVDLIEQEQRVFHAHFGHLLDQFARHGANIGTTVTANFRFVTHAAKRHTDVLTSCRFGDGLTQRGFTHPRRSNQTQDWAFEFVHTALYREILKDAVFDTLKAIVVGIEHFLRLTQVFFHFTARIPRNLNHPLDITADHGGFRRHRGHHF